MEYPIGYNLGNSQSYLGRTRANYGKNELYEDLIKSSRRIPEGKYIKDE